MATEDNQNNVNQVKKPVDRMWRSDGHFRETTTKYDDGTVERTFERIVWNKRASRTSISAEDLKNLQRNQQLPFEPTSSSSSPQTQKPKDRNTEQER
jgi:hypothetical protein